MTQLVEIVLTDEQIGLLGAAADITLRSHADEEHGLVTLTDEEQDEFKRLAVFLTAVSDSPQSFPVTGRMAPRLKTKKPRVAKTTFESVRNKRKARQERRIGAAKRRRAARRELVAAHNLVREQTEREQEQQRREHEALIARLDAEPKYDIKDAQGNVVISGVPASMVVPQDDKLSPELERALEGLYLPEPAQT